ncbi:hypothetical protein MKW94_023646 [Papaver nudicaule]|uniref:Uncharacterized protein n=1 Tax=Papaver nudicaule TaxID=74823 RepID=A0AA41VGB1_PAPNU|nr:hypothetical protein [Papaver nudicaule]
MRGAVRNTATGTGVKETILKETPSAKIEVLELDLSYMASVRKFAGEFETLDLFLETMKRIASQSNIEGRIVNVSFESHKYPYKDGIHFDNLNDESGYSSFGAYGQSKLANVLHANELSRGLKVLFVSFFSL